MIKGWLLDPSLRKKKAKADKGTIHRKQALYNRKREMADSIFGFK